MGKRVPLDRFRIQNRAGAGLKSIKLNEGDLLSAVEVVRPQCSACVLVVIVISSLLLPILCAWRLLHEQALDTRYSPGTCVWGLRCEIKRGSVAIETTLLIL
jgi:hypothetical protein